MKYEYEIVPIGNKYPAKILLQDKPGSRCNKSKHWHKAFEIDYMIEGNLLIQVNDEITSLSNDTFIFINSEEVHSSISQKPQENVKYLVILLSYEVAKQYFENIDNIIFKFEKIVEIKLREKLRRLSEVFEEKRSFYELQVNEMLFQIYYIIFTECKREEKNLEDKYCNEENTYARKAIEYLTWNFREEISLNDMAQYVGITPNYFCKCFKKSVNMTFKQYLDSIRLENALKDMTYFNVSVTNAALNNGFANIKGFIKLCKEKYGCTPNQYKKLQLMKKQN